MDLIKVFYQKLEKEHRNLKWWLDHYLPNTYYATLQNQLKRRVNLNDKTKKAIKRFLDL